jgi:hypothetical protein
MIYEEKELTPITNQEEGEDTKETEGTEKTEDAEETEKEVE